MGFIKAFSGAISSTFADQWKDFYVPRQNVSATTALFEAVLKQTNNGVGENYKGSSNIITNGSKIVVQEGMALITLQDGAITGFIAEAGGYIYTSNDPNSRSFFGGNGILSSTISQSWERFKFGGQASSEQLAFYVNLKEIPNIKFGTREPVYWQDSYLASKAGGMARGSYSLKITDPISFIKNVVPAKYLQPDADVFDLDDVDRNDVAAQLFNEFTSVLPSTFAKLSMMASNSNMDTMDFINSNLLNFTNSMNVELENGYHWTSMRGLTLQTANIIFNYDSATQEILNQVRKDDTEIRKATRMGNVYSGNMAGMMAAASAEAMKSAAANENGAMMGFMGMNMAQQNGMSMLGAVQDLSSSQNQPTKSPVTEDTSTSSSLSSQEDPYEKLARLKKLLDEGIISEQDFNDAKAKVLGL